MDEAQQAIARPTCHTAQFGDELGFAEISTKRGGRCPRGRVFYNTANRKRIA